MLYFSVRRKKHVKMQFLRPSGIQIGYIFVYLRPKCLKAVIYVRDTSKRQKLLEVNP